MVLVDRTLKMHEIVKIISQGVVVSILNDHLNMKMLIARRVPRLLKVDHNYHGVTSLKECLALFNSNLEKIMRGFITVDKTYRKPNSSLNSGFQRANCHRRRLRLSLSANKAMTYSTTFRSKTNRVWPSRKYCSIKAMERCTWV